MRIPRAVVRLAAAVKPALPGAAHESCIQAWSLVAGPTLVGLPAFRRVLVVAPHPDDETIGCGGTIALCAQDGAEIRVVVATDGEATIGSTAPAHVVARRRREESVEACRLLGVRPPVALGLPDGALSGHLPALVEALQAQAHEIGPDLLLAPWPHDRHPDHRAAAVAAAVVARTSRCDLWGYETHAPLPPDHAVDITAVIERKRAALDAHATAGKAFDLDATLGLNRWRSLVTGEGRGYAECFSILRALAADNISADIEHRPHRTVGQQPRKGG